MNKEATANIDYTNDKELDIYLETHLEDLTLSEAKDMIKKLTDVVKDHNSRTIDTRHEFDIEPPTWLSHLILMSEKTKVDEYVNTARRDVSKRKLQLYLDGFELRSENFEVFMNEIEKCLEQEIKEKLTESLTKANDINYAIESRAEEMLEEFCDKIIDDSNILKRELDIYIWKRSKRSRGENKDG